ncbi:hypothetical protein [Cellulosimicrobium cellulans]|uniref:hypothetical protein n=1 Tax=Cellulosimicrobium cellulans TaxID=1710 RepID=UPI00209699DC|nr:hypothetical protein [Cellulosimicrobium cellulans]MCO7275088.1 hypothetical protein [Cellulosimicrobium cellulans]
MPEEKHVTVRESVAIWAAGTAVVVMPLSASVWDTEADAAADDGYCPVRVEWLQELRTTLDADHQVVCAPLEDPDWLVLPEADLAQVRRVLREEGYDVVVADPVAEMPGAGGAPVELEIDDLLGSVPLPER